MEVTGTRSGASGMRRVPSSPSSAATASRCRRAPAGRRTSASPTWTRSAWTVTSSHPTSGSIGSLVDRAVTFATPVDGGGMSECPELKIALGHGGGYTCYGVGRMDHAWKVRSAARVHVRQPPSAYLRRFYYDCIVYTEEALRYLIDTVGVDRVVFGTDWPYDMALDWPVSWVLGMKSLTQEEKEAILSKNLERLLSL